MRVRAAVLTEPGLPLEIATLDLAPPQTGEVLVRVAASGVCGTDLSNAKAGQHLARPIVLGHEGAGIVEVVGQGVRTCTPGQHVVLSLISQCGTCRACAHGRPYLCEPGSRAQSTSSLLDGTTRLSSPAGPVHQFLGLGTFAEAVVVPEQAVVPIPGDVDLGLAALLGCAVSTALGAVFNTAPVARGDFVVVNGCGGVGLNVVQGAALAGAARVIAVDPDVSKQSTALRLGATHMGSPEGAQEVIRAATDGRGADVVYDLVGKEDTIEFSLRALGRGGTLCVIGAQRTAQLRLPVVEELIINAKRVVGCSYGSTDIRRDIPRAVSDLRSGRLDLDSLVTSRRALSEVNAALDDLERGIGIRTVIEL